MGLSQYDERTPVLMTGVILPSDAGAYLTLVPAQLVPVRIDAIQLLNYDSIAHVTGWRLNVGGADYGFGSVNSIIMAGFSGTARTEVVPEITPAAVGALILPVGVILKWNAGATVGAGGSITAFVYGGFV